MAAAKSGDNLDKWRTYFKNPDYDIFDIIENAIMVAAVDSPQEFKSRRDQIVQTLFSFKFVKCVGCDGMESMSVPGEENKVEQGCNDRGAGEVLGSGNKDGKAKSGGGDDHNGEMNRKKIDAKAISDHGIRDECRILDEVLRIKQFLDNGINEDASLVLKSLHRLKSMHMTLEILKATKVGKTVTALRKHASADVQNFARALVEVWKIMVTEWMTAEATTADPQNREDSKRKTVDGRKLQVEGGKTQKQRQQAKSVAPVLKKEEPTKKEEASVKIQATVPKPIKPLSNLRSKAGNSSKPSLDNKAISETKLQTKPNSTSQSPAIHEQKKRTGPNEDAPEVKPKSTKRRL